MLSCFFCFNALSFFLPFWLARRLFSVQPSFFLFCFSTSFLLFLRFSATFSCLLFQPLSFFCSAPLSFVSLDVLPYFFSPKQFSLQPKNIFFSPKRFCFSPKPFSVQPTPLFQPLFVLFQPFFLFVGSVFSAPFLLSFSAPHSLFLANFQGQKYSLQMLYISFI